MENKAEANRSEPATATKTNEPASPSGSSLTRRGFLRNSSAAGVGIGLIVTSKTAIGQIGTKDGDVRLGIIGCGAQAEALRAASSVVDGVKFGAVADIQKDAIGGMYGRIRASKKGLGSDGTEIKRYLDPQQLLDESKGNCSSMASSSPALTTTTTTGRARRSQPGSTSTARN